MEDTRRSRTATHADDRSVHDGDVLHRTFRQRMFLLSSESTVAEMARVLVGATRRVPTRLRQFSRRPSDTAQARKFVKSLANNARLLIGQTTTGSELQRASTRLDVMLHNILCRLTLHIPSRRKICQPQVLLASFVSIKSTTVLCLGERRCTPELRKIYCR